MVFPLKFLNSGPREVKHELIALQFQFTLRLANHPVGMLLEQFALGIAISGSIQIPKRNRVSLRRPAARPVPAGANDWAANRPGPHGR